MSNAVSAPTNVYEALAIARSRMPYVKKEGQMKGGQSYNYARIEDIIRELRKILDDLGLVIFPVSASLIEAHDYSTSSGKLMHNSKVRCSYKVAHASSSTLTEAIEVIGEADDMGDKSSNKAQTAALKKALLQLFMVETGDMDPDTYASNHRNGDVVSDIYEKAKAALERAGDRDTMTKVWTHIEKRYGEGQITSEQFSSLQKQFATLAVA